MKRCTSLFLLLVLTMSLVGCNQLRRLCKRSCVQVNSGRFVLRVGCRAPCIAVASAPLAGTVPKVANLLDGVISRGAIAGSFGACDDVCREFGEDSEECDQCRTAVGIAVTQPYFNFCQGTAYEPLPNSMKVSLEVDTDRGTFVSPPLTAEKRRGTVRYDNCGGENADFVFTEEAQLRDWGLRVHRESGARQVDEIRIARVDTAADESLFKLKSEFKNLDGAVTLDPIVHGLHTSLWLFNGGGADGDPDGAITPVPMLPDLTVSVGGGFSFSGELVQSLKPCSSDDDCSGTSSTTYCAEDRYCRAR